MSWQIYSVPRVQLIHHQNVQNEKVFTIFYFFVNFEIGNIKIKPFKKLKKGITHFKSFMYLLTFKVKVGE